MDHIIPIAVVPELNNVTANLELNALKANEEKKANVGERELDLGRKLHRGGLLSDEGLKKLEAARKKEQGAEGKAEGGKRWRFSDFAKRRCFWANDT